MRWLAVDAGLARVGLAICDPDERIAVPLEVVPAGVAFPAIRTIVSRDGVQGVVVGLPLTPRGREETSAQMARKLGERIERVLGLPVEYEDERFTSVEAERLDTRPRDRRRSSDDLAAVLILEQFLARRRREARDQLAGGRAQDAARVKDGDSAGGDADG
ncbi:MAG: Holliday junction resolvase RuvX [Chloroflexi bacterium]|nr:Holliday junction resolvase RuvX [Chloroflexota bacterium]